MTEFVVVDVGNTSSKCGRYTKGRVTEVAILEISALAESEKFFLPPWHLPDSTLWVLAGSNPCKRDEIAERLLKQNHLVSVIDSYIQLPLTVNVEQPEKVGLDRLLNAVAVNIRRPAGTAAIVVDAGTAITVDLVDQAGIFQGGAILPGLGMMARSLHRDTALLPQLEKKTLLQAKRLSDGPGKSTAEALLLGISAAAAGAVERIAQGYRRLINGPTFCYFGGGDGAALYTQIRLENVHLWDEMTLEGIAHCQSKARPLCRS